MKRFFEVTFLIVAIVLALMLPFLLKVVLNTSIPLAAVESSSMIPTLNIGDVVIIVGVNPEDIKVNDIIVYNKVVLKPSPESAIIPLRTPIIHRVVGMVNVNGRIFFITKGDGNIVRDSWYVPEEGVLGKAVMINGYPLRVPYVGYFSLFFHALTKS